MSDEEEEYDEEGEEEEEDEEEWDEDEDVEDEEEAAARVQKELNVQQDIANLYGVFTYIDKVSKRIGGHIQRDLRDYEATIKQQEHHARLAASADKGSIEPGSSSSSSTPRHAYYPPCPPGGYAAPGGGVYSDLSLHWEDYENMNELERAQLLERAIGVLTDEAGVAVAGNGRSGGKHGVKPGGRHGKRGGSSRRRHSSSSSSNSYSSDDY